MRPLGVLAATVLAGCLSPPDGGQVDAAGSDETDAGRQRDAGGGSDGGGCSLYFAVSYAETYSAGTVGGQIFGVALIEALSDGVDLSTLFDAGDESTILDLAFEAPSFNTVEPGTAHGFLDPKVSELVIDTLVPQRAWADMEAPELRLDVGAAKLPNGTNTMEMTARLEIGSSPKASVDLHFAVTYSGMSNNTITPVGVHRVISTCTD